MFLLIYETGEAFLKEDLDLVQCNEIAAGVLDAFDLSIKPIRRINEDFVWEEIPNHD